MQCFPAPFQTTRKVQNFDAKGSVIKNCILYNDGGHRPEIIDSNARPTALGYRSNGGFYKDAEAMPLAIKCYNDEGHRPEIILEHIYRNRSKGA